MVWPSMMGTALHSLIEECLDSYSLGAYILESKVEFEGLPGHVDWWYPEDGAIIDWKTKTKKNLDYFPSTQEIWQVQTYAYMKAQEGCEVKTVTLFALPRDGDESDFLCHTEPYNEAIALQAIAWLAEVKAMEEPPSPEMPAEVFCKKYCTFFGVSCEGKTDRKSGDAITDPIAISAALEYVEISEQIKLLEARKDGAKDALENVDGITPDGISVSWSSIAGRKTIDEVAVMAAMGEIPRKQGEPSSRLAVKR